MLIQRMNTQPVTDIDGKFLQVGRMVTDKLGRRTGQVKSFGQTFVRVQWVNGRTCTMRPTRVRVAA